MREKILFAVCIALASWSALSAPCRAQDSTEHIPVLKRYTGRDWIYFASASDGALIFENRPGDASNVWVAVGRSTPNRRILAKTDIWTDSQGHLHTVNVLKRQIEFNDYVNDYVNAAGIPNSNPYWGGKVQESGILDIATLAIPTTKLYNRAKKIANRLDAEVADAERIESVNSNGAITKKKFASYLREKVANAMVLLNELSGTIFAVPRSKPGEEAPAVRPGADTLNGLHGLEVPVITTYSPYDLDLVSASSGVVRFNSGYDYIGSESESIDPLKITPAIIEDIQAKEAAAEKAVAFAETLCKDLLTPPCE